MADEFTRLEFAWLAQLARDAALPPLSLRLGIALLRYFNRETRSAWPAVATLAADLDTADRSIRRAIAALAPRHLSVIAGGGRNATNQYRMVVHGDGKPGQSRQGFDDDKTLTAPSPFSGRKPGPRRQGIVPETLTEPSANPDGSVRKTLTAPSAKPSEENLLKEHTESISIESKIFEPGKKAAEKRSPNTPKKGKPGASEADFETWWKLYPKKVSKKGSRVAFDRAISGKVNLAELMLATTRYAETCDPRFYKNPDGWLNGERWADESQAPAHRKAVQSGQAAAGGIPSALEGIFSKSDDFP